jgi:hypothetical protein
MKLLAASAAQGLTRSFRWCFMVFVGGGGDNDSRVGLGVKCA